MVRVLLVTLTLTLACSFSDYADAGWLGDKLKKAADSVGSDLIKDVTDGVYKGTNDVISPEGKETDQGAEEPVEKLQVTEDTGQGSDDSGQEAGYQERPEYDGEYPGPSEFEGQYSERMGDEGEYAEEEFEEVAEPPWGEEGFVQRSGKNRRQGLPRTDLHLSADMIMHDSEAPEPMKGKLYIDGTRIRTEWSSELGMIVTGVEASDKVYVLMHKEKTYFESTNEDSEAFFIEDIKPCDGYTNTKELGRVELNGRSAVKWRCLEPEDPENDATITVWFDKKLEFPVRWEGENSGFWELANIREGKPSADLFRLPADYKKMVADAMPTAKSLPAEEEKLIKGAGVPLYPMARFVYGNPNVGFRFASAEPVEKVQAWYKGKLPSWPVYKDKFGSWIIYNGEPGANMAQLVLQKTQVSIRKNEDLPQWHSLDKDVTTEIVIFIDQK